MRDNGRAEQMRKRDGAVESRLFTGQAQFEAGSFARETAQEPPASNRASRGDQLAYLSDMIAELTTMAQRLGCPTLAGILDLAQREAHLEKSRT